MSVKDEAEFVAGVITGKELLLREKIESLRAKLAAKDKRIKELYELTAAPLAAVLLYEQVQAGEVRVITDAQINAAWGMADEDHVDSLSVVATLEELGIHCCKECGGSGHWEQEPQTGGCYPDQTPECTSCDGHGWIKTSTDVDKCGQFGTEE